MNASNQQQLAVEYVEAVDVEDRCAEKLLDAWHRGDELDMQVACYWHGLATMKRAQVARDYYAAVTGRKPVRSVR